MNHYRTKAVRLRAVLLHEVPVNPIMSVQNHIFTIFIGATFMITIHLKSHK